MVSEMADMYIEGSVFSLTLSFFAAGNESW